MYRDGTVVVRHDRMVVVYCDKTTVVCCVRTVVVCRNNIAIVRLISYFVSGQQSCVVRGQSL